MRTVREGQAGGRTSRGGRKALAERGTTFLQGQCRSAYGKRRHLRARQPASAISMPEARTESGRELKKRMRWLIDFFFSNRIPVVDCGERESPWSSSFDHLRE